MSKIELKEGEVFKGAYDFTRERMPHRRIVTIHGDAVCYSSGGDRSYICTRNSFLRWVRKQQKSIKKAKDAESAKSK